MMQHGRMALSTISPFLSSVPTSSGQKVMGTALERLLSSSLAAASESGPLTIDRSLTSCFIGSHPVGSTLGGVAASTPPWPLILQLRAMSMRVMSIRSYDLCALVNLYS